MHPASSDQYHRTVAALAAAAARLPRTLRGALRGPHLRQYLRAYYGNVEAVDLAGRDPR